MSFFKLMFEYEFEIISEYQIMNCKNLIYFLILIFVVSSCAFSGCLDSGSSSNNSVGNSSKTVKSTGPVGISEADFNKAAQAAEQNFYDARIYIIDDISVVYTQSNNTITVVVGVLDSTKGLTAKNAAEVVLKELNNEVRSYNSSVKPSSSNYYGGLYDECNILIYVVPINNMYDKKYWYVSQYISSGSHRPIMLEKMYASGSMYV